jgi:hypothetical protein
MMTQQEALRLRIGEELFLTNDPGLPRQFGKITFRSFTGRYDKQNNLILEIEEGSWISWISTKYLKLKSELVA